MCTKEFLKAIFENSKKLLKIGDTKFISVIKYDEISVKELYQRFMSLNGVSDYFPDKYPKGRQCDREYMFNVVNTLHPNVVQEVVNHALR